jgi:hypothetical protein
LDFVAAGWRGRRCCGCQVEESEEEEEIDGVCYCELHFSLTVVRALSLPRNNFQRCLDKSTKSLVILKKEVDRS